MTPDALTILTNPTGHIVYPHMDDAHLAEAVGFFASTGLRQDEAVILIMAAAHRQAIRQRLGREGFNLEELESTGQLVCANAEELISQFLVEGNIYEQRFRAIFGAMIEQAKAYDGKKRPVRVFGEMVDLLWQSNPRITQRIEELWNDVIKAHAVPLLCAYSLAGIKPGAFPEELIACHSHEVV